MYVVSTAVVQSEEQGTISIPVRVDARPVVKVGEIVEKLDSVMVAVTVVTPLDELVVERAVTRVCSVTVLVAVNRGNGVGPLTGFFWDLVTPRPTATATRVAITSPAMTAMITFRRFLLLDLPAGS